MFFTVRLKKLSEAHHFVEDLKLVRNAFVNKDYFALLRSRIIF
jgi:hypothetical protein